MSKPPHDLWNTGNIRICKLIQCFSAGQKHQALHWSMLCLWCCRVALVTATVDSLHIDVPSVLTAGFQTGFYTVCCQSRWLIFRDACLFSAGPQAKSQSDHFTAARLRSKVATVWAGLPFNVCPVVWKLVALINLVFIWCYAKPTDYSCKADNSSNSI